MHADENKTKSQLLAEIADLRQRLARLEHLEEDYRQTIDSLHKSDELFRTAFKTSPDAISISRLSDGQFVNVNQRFEHIFGFDRHELLGKTAIELGIWCNPADRDQMVVEMTQHGQVSNLPVKFRAKSGRVITGLFSAKLITLYNEPQLLAITRDITEWEDAQLQIRQHNQKLELLNRIIAASAANLEPNHILEVACRELAENFAAPRVFAAMFSKDKSTAVVVAEYLSGDQPSIHNQAIPIQGNPVTQYLLQNKAPLIVTDTQNDARLVAAQNWIDELKVISFLAAPLVIGDEVVGSLEVDYPLPRNFLPNEVNLIWSVTDQVASAVSKAWLNEERVLLSTAINQTADIIVVADNQGIILYANPAFEQITGYHRLEVVGRRAFIVPNPAHPLEFYDELWATIRAGQVWQGNITNQKKDGSLYTAKATITPVKDEAGAIVNYVNTQVDITRELELEKQYRQAQKMEAIGQLTTGIAHDFNNLLMAINGFAELMQFRLPKDSPFQDMASRILASGESAANLIRQLLVFSRKQMVEPKVLNLNTTVTEIDKMLRRIISEDINLQILLVPNLWPIKIDAAQIEQIIVNLVVNARDAMPTGGNIAIETSNTRFDGSIADLLGVPPGDYVVLSVTDTGVGMNEQVKQHIFEPFFTTKEHGKGTGLGLATVYGIVKQNGGEIKVFSQEGQGSTFEVYLPRVAALPEELPADVGVGKLSQGTETVLLVEDSSVVRELVAQTLSAQGYKVIKAGHGEEALALFKNYSGEIHLLLTDVVMPQMDGNELVNRITQLKPDIKVIFTSGYNNDAISHYGVLDPNITFLQKPFSPGTLIAIVREVLDRP